MSEQRTAEDLFQGEGTPEAEWQAWPGLQLPGVEPSDLLPVGRVVVVSPHPDDETLAVGGTTAQLVALGAQVLVIAVTDGGASHPGSPTLSPDQLVERRDAERREALHRLGFPAAVRRLGRPDGAAADGETQTITEMISLITSDDLVLAPWDHDGHPDHDSAGRAAAQACERVGARLVSYPVWMWHWAAPGDRRVPWDRAGRVELTPQLLDRKRVAVQAFSTQVAPLSEHPADRTVLPTYVLDRLTRPFEVLFDGVRP